ncbi:MAG: esterase-like activity of phytase family protein [Oscillatoria sp. PMC 1068.18]|nr:esterase-like activity of phytase family protein [Oscillatoria sp. PMC 1076.18]MEC4989798.1 esterase-like activity of phytase family protein [Oscillatoria sp. PMC 1068.18]
MVQINEIQGSGLTSPLVGQTVTEVVGIVTAVVDNGFYFQDPTPDNNPASSEGIFVFTSSEPTVSVGDEVEVAGTVTEFFPGGQSTGNLSTTEITNPTVTILSSNNSLPDPILIGGEGRIPPTEIINPNGIEFYESLEGMLVTVNDAVAVSPTNRFGEIFTVVDNGENATGISDRGTINISPEDFNPERVQIQFDNDLLPDFTPQVNVGDILGDVTGVVSYAFGNFEVLATAEFTPTDANLEPETTALVATETKLTVATYNVLNLDPNDADGDEDIADGQFEDIANQIVINLQNPDIIALQEIQDNSGSTDDGTTAADVNLQILTDAIVAAGGVNYSFIDAPTNNNENGGQPGGNIRVAYLYNPDRVDLVSGSVEIVPDNDLSDGDAFEDSRKSLAATFEFAGEEVTIINNHFSSKSGSTPLFSTEPLINGSEDERIVQAEAVNSYVDDILAANAEANVIVLGDLNEFEFETAVEILEADILTNLTETLPEDERYSYIFQGNSQSLDHILVSNNLAAKAEFDAVHVNSEFPDQASDHDPLIVSLNLVEETPTFTAVNDDDVQTFINTPVTIDVLANDIDDDDDPSDLRVANIFGVNNGTVQINEDGTITFTPNPSFRGKEDFNYTLTDDEGNEATARAIVTVSEEEVPAVTLVGFASLPADTFADGPPSGEGISTDNRSVPFDNQPVQGFSGVQFAPNDDGSYWFLSDNGFGSRLNSDDYLLRIYQVDPDFAGTEDGDASVEVEDFIQLSDPNNLVPFEIVNEDTSDRWLTGADFDIESIVVAKDDSIWIGDEFGPYLLHFNSEGILIDAPIPTPNIFELDTLNGQTPLVIGHRGASGDLPEHTLEAYALAMEQGADFIEPDLVSTQDGVLIARHEPWLGGTTDVAEKFPDRRTSKEVDGVLIENEFFVDDFTLAEIKQLRAVQPRDFRDQSFNGLYEIPTFEEVIELVQAYELETGREVGIYPETKHPTYFDELGLSLEEKLIQTLQDTGFTDPDRIFIQSFEIQNLLELQNELLPAAGLSDLPLVQLLGDFTESFLQPDDSFSRPYDVFFNFSQPGFIEADAREIYGDLVDLVDLNAETDYGDLANPEVIINFIATYAEGLGPWKNSFLLRESLDEPVDGNGDGVAEITTQLTGEVLPLIEWAHDAGLQVHPYTLRNEERFLTLNADGTPQTPEEEFEQLIELGADGFFTDFPATGDEVRDEITGDFVRSPDNPEVLTGSEVANLPGSRGFEGMAYSPDRQTLYPLLEGPVTGDPDNSRRIYEFDVASKEYVGLVGFYGTEDPSYAIGDFTPINDTEFLVIERDGGQGDTAEFKKIFKIDISEIDEAGFVAKEEVVNLLQIADPDDLNDDGSTFFDFPFVTIEDVLVIDENTILVANDNNYPFSIGRGLDIDNNEIILLELAEPLNLDPRLGSDPLIFAAENDTAQTAINTPVTIDVLANDSDDDGDNSDLEITSISGNNNGTVEINADGTITFTPNPGFKGKEDFNYVLTDEDGNTATGRVIVEVTNDLPTEFAAVDDNFSTTPGTPVTFDLLANDTDDDNDDSDLEITNIVGVSNGTVEINPDGTITFTPNSNFRGKEDFYYTLTDADGNTDTGRAIVTVSEEQNEEFTLQILHTADQEGGLPAIQDAVNFSAVIEALADDFANTLRLSSGDIYIPGPFFAASDVVFGEPGIGDILINNALGFQAVAFGNHEFDANTGVVKTLLEANSEIDLAAVGEPGEFPTIQGLGTYPGTEFPYLSSNLDFAPDENLADLVVAAGEEPEGNTITKSVVIDVNGEPIGVVGATTPTLESISSPGDVDALPNDADDFAALAAIIQAEVDALTAEGIDKIVLLSHFQQISIEQEVAALLDDVDIVIGGGSNTLLANEDDPLRAGDEIEGLYPIAVESAGETVYVINTDGNYQYVGRLAVTFDANGVITEILDASGAYATDDAGVDRVYGTDVDASEVANPLVVEVTEAIADVVLEKDGNIFGRTEVFLNGTRGDVRTQETNLGNLTADANLFIAQEYDPTVVISIKNGGGIRDNIGQAIVPPGGTSDDLEKTSPAANPLVGKEEGDISQLDIENSLRFNNELSLLTVTVEELEQILEYGVSATETGATPGQFPQVGGLSFSFDPDGQVIEIDESGNIVTDGTRIQNVALIDEAGEVETVLVENGAIVVDPSQEIRLVTLNFLAGGGDGYPFEVFGENRVDLVEQPIPAGSTNVATFAASGTEQDALAEYLAVNFPSDDDPNTPVFDVEDVPPAEDERIQNLNAVSEDTVLGIAAATSLAAEPLTNAQLSDFEANSLATEIVEPQQLSFSSDSFSADIAGFDPTSLAAFDDSFNGDLVAI